MTSVFIHPRMSQAPASPSPLIKSGCRSFMTFRRPFPVPRPPKFPTADYSGDSATHQ
jgi:hypothetical protein